MWHTALMKRAETVLGGLNELVSCLLEARDGIALPGFRCYAGGSFLLTQGRSFKRAANVTAADPRRRVSPESRARIRHTGSCQGGRLELISYETSRPRELPRSRARRSGFEEPQ